MKSKVITAIDPGTNVSGVVSYSPTDKCVLYRDISSNANLALELESIWFQVGEHYDEHHLAIEMVASYGMAVGREVFEAVAWIGRFEQCWHELRGVYPRRIYRKDVKLHLCGSPRAKDANIRQALLDLFPATGGGKTPQIGTKAKPGPLYGMKSHMWAALAVAVTAAEVELFDGGTS